MAKTDILKAIRERDWTTATKRIGKLLEQKTTRRMMAEKQRVATGLLVPRLTEGVYDDFVKRVGNDKNWQSLPIKKCSCGQKFYQEEPSQRECRDCISVRQTLGERHIYEGFRRGEKVVLQHASTMGGYIATRPNGQRTRVPIGSTGEFVRQKDSTWSVVWFQQFYDSTDVKTSDISSLSAALYDESKSLGESAIEVGDRVRTKKMGQTPGTVVKVENGNVHFELDEPAGKFGKRVWVAPISNIVKESFDKDYPNRKDQRAPYYKSALKVVRSDRPGGDPDSYEAQNRLHSTRKREDSAKDSEDDDVNEETISQHEVQRIYNEVGDIGETELLCGISGLRVNPQGQVISYICEGT